MDYDTEYDKRFDKLNDRQKEAVNTIEGPIMVVAGPGTGKTELLGMRVASILRKTDSLPENILCLTFTDAGSLAMQKRLNDIIGKNAYDVSIFTFHAFGSEVINHYREFFYNGADFSPTDELKQRQIITAILDTLPYNSPLKSSMNGEYTSIKSVLSGISELKRAGLTPAEFQTFLESNKQVYDIIDPILTEALDGKMSAGTLPKLEAIIPQIMSITESVVIPDVEPFSVIFCRSLLRAIEQAHEHSRTTPPLTEWKKVWTKKNANGENILKSSYYSDKLFALCHVYASYLEEMQKAKLYDYDDMIMQVVHAMEDHPELRYELQEKYHYIMVDEFQDTNMAQMRILHNLTNNPVVENEPNILVVGDDDQAIYSFQGADVGNILHFKDKYNNVKLIPLIDNYRSVADILAPSREVITQGKDRLESTIENLSKELVAHKEVSDSEVQIVDLARSSDERQWVAKDIRKQLDSGVPAKEIAVIARGRTSLDGLVQYFIDENIPISYDKRDNVLDDEVIRILTLLANTVINLHKQELAHANENIPELLSHPAWGIDPSILWQISLEAYKSRRLWLEVMEVVEDTQTLVKWLHALANNVSSVPLERMMDYLIGNQALDEAPDFTSPLKKYFFSVDSWINDTGTYISLLNNLTTLRTKLREHNPDASRPRLTDFIAFINALNDAETTINSTRHIGEESSAVSFQTAHGSKGLEFDSVYVVDVIQDNWKGGKKGGANITFPENTMITTHANTEDDELRLLFVAMTRAKRRLSISYAHENDKSKEKSIAKFITDLAHINYKEQTIEQSKQTEENVAEKAWYEPIVGLPKDSKKEYLADMLRTYKISATAINAFTDIERTGPEMFLLNNLLHFPSARPPAAEFGQAIHSALQHAHDYLRAHGKKPSVEDIIQAFEEALKKSSLTETELVDKLEKGRDVLNKYLALHYDSFNQNQVAELNFGGQNVVIDDVRLTGKMDVVEIDKEAREIIITDYKTGKPLDAWGKGDKLKSHNYRQQLLFYKLLVEYSRDWKDYSMTQAILQFVEPDKMTDEIHSLSITGFDDEEMDRFKKLLKAVWEHIQNLDFPDTSHYPEGIKGIEQFEQDLIDGKI